MRQDEVQAAHLLSDPASIGTPMFVLLLDRFGTDMLDWEPETLRMEIEGQWGVIPPQENRDKIWALINIVSTNLFNVSLEFFIHAANALSGEGADFGNYDPATVTEMCWALAEQHLIAPLDENEDFSTEILEYMKRALREEGFSQVPQLMKPHVGSEIDLQEDVESALALDGIDANAFWDRQTRDRMRVDEYVTRRLTRLISEVASLPLREADQRAVKQLKARADKALAAQSLEIEQGQEAVSPIPFA